MYDASALHVQYMLKKVMVQVLSRRCAFTVQQQCSMQLLEGSVALGCGTLGQSANQPAGLLQPAVCRRQAVQYVLHLGPVDSAGPKKLTVRMYIWETVLAGT